MPLSVFGISMVRDEDDIIGYTLPRMAAQLDHVIVADNRSSDGTTTQLEVLARALGNVSVVDDPEPAYLQSQKMSDLARQAGDMGADWVVPFDADEVWVSASGPLRDVVPLYREHLGIEATLFDHVATGADDPQNLDTCQRISYRRTEPLPLRKVAARVMPGLVIEMGNHGIRFPRSHSQSGSDIVVHHFPYRSVDQMVKKVRNGASAYRAAEGRVPAGAGVHWKSYDALSDEQIEEVFFTWFFCEDPQDDDGLVQDILCSISMLR